MFLLHYCIECDTLQKKLNLNVNEKKHLQNCKHKKKILK